MAVPGPDLPDPAFTDEELVRTVTDFAPAAARIKVPFGFNFVTGRPRTLIVRYDPKPRRPQRRRKVINIKGPNPLELRVSPDGKVQFLYGRGRPGLPCYRENDEFYPVMEWAAHHIARRIKKLHHGGITPRDLARRFRIPESTLEDVLLMAPHQSVPLIISYLRCWLTKGGEPIANESYLEKFRARWRRTLPKRLCRAEERKLLEQYARDFLDEQPPGSRS
jgi:hypothetical protein